MHIFEYVFMNRSSTAAKMGEIEKRKRKALTPSCNSPLLVRLPVRVKSVFKALVPEYCIEIKSALSAQTALNINSKFGDLCFEIQLIRDKDPNNYKIASVKVKDEYHLITIICFLLSTPFLTSSTLQSLSNCPWVLEHNNPFPISSMEDQATGVLCASHESWCY
uniref:Uncharacterized protein n=1 Tax=Glossina pallidipes TaxID=7398 RepID=A0A1B0AHH6_GLOPL